MSCEGCIARFARPPLLEASAKGPLKHKMEILVVDEFQMGMGMLQDALNNMS